MAFTFEQFPTLETERFRLREMRMDDASDLFAYYADPEVVKFYSIVPMTDPEQARQRIRRKYMQYANKAEVVWAIASREDDRLIGTVSLFYWQESNAKAEVGLELARPYWGKGIATEVLDAVLQFGFETAGLNRIEAACDPENLGSARRLVKSGFREEGLQKEHVRMPDGRFTDTQLFAILRRDYEARKKGQGAAQ